MSNLDIIRESGAAPAIDAVAAAAHPEHRFLRAAWYAAAADGPEISTLVARRSDGGEMLAALPLAARGGRFRFVKEVPGSYWPYRSFPVSKAATDADLAAILAHPKARAELGRAWRLGPVYADDPTASRLLAVADRSGWSILSRRVATSYLLDLARLRGEGQWPTSKTLRKNRWLERRLADHGELTFTSVSGREWSPPIFETLAEIERDSWVGRRGGDSKFLDPAVRAMWERAVQDPLLAESLACTLLHVGGTPAAFVFTLRTGTTLHCIANSFSEQFAEQSPGRLLLYREFALAADKGFELVDWGGGDAGYKTEMGGLPGAEILDHLLVRGRLLAALLRPVWNRGSA
jgi:CelD/BcsL family acetyltransferase involved in cellulose biosynthesis